MRQRRRRSREPWWAALPTERLLDVRLCDLRLSLRGTALQRRIDALHRELRRAGLVFRPYVWLSTEWFTPEGSTGFAVPFWLAHPRLVRLEHAMMFEAEGSRHDWCMKLLRHEAAHAFDNAWRLHRRADWRATFGRYGEPYRAVYRVRPNSRDHVQNLGAWYAQSHPAEDYAETFAVWLAPAARWRETYADWPALGKLTSLDKMLKDVGDLPPPVRSRDRDGALATLTTTLREHYRRKQASYGVQQPWRHDRELRLVFDPPGARASRRRAGTYLERHRTSLRAGVSLLTGHHRYVVDQALDAMIQRCRGLDLRCRRASKAARLGAAVLSTIVTLALARRRPGFRR